VRAEASITSAPVSGKSTISNARSVTAEMRSHHWLPPYANGAGLYPPEFQRGPNLFFTAGGTVLVPANSR